MEHIQALSEPTRTRAHWLVWAARTAGYPVVITSSRRTLAQQRRLVAERRSRTLNSKHVRGQAFDIDIHGMSRDDIPKWFWNMIGPWAERELGLKWGGRWKSIYDPGHFES